MNERRLFWLGSSLEDVRAFPETARQRAGFELSEVQNGRMPSDWKPMTTVGAGVHEIRIHIGIEYRVLYVAKFSEGIYVLHAFEKKTQRTRQHDLALAKQRLNDLIRERGQTGFGDKTRKAFMTQRKSRTTIIPSSGNVFTDLGFAPEQSEHLKLRAQLMGAVRDVIQRRGLTQTQAAKLLGVTQPRISDLMRGKVELFSMDILVTMLAQAGVHVELTIDAAA